MFDRHATAQGSGIEIAAIASAVPEYAIDQTVTRDMVLTIAPEFRSYESVFSEHHNRNALRVPLAWHLQSCG
jgi:hypothetical protein